MSGKTQTARRRLRVEAALLKKIQLNFGNGDTRLFRNNVGSAFLGPHFWTADGGVLIQNPSRVTYGLCEGSSDLIGWRSRTITHTDVGKTIAQFVAIEVKSAAGKLSKTQEAFLRTATDAGAVAGMVKTVDEAKRLLKGEDHGD